MEATLLGSWGSWPSGPRHGLSTEYTHLAEELLLASQPYAGPILPLTLESRESAFEISPVPRTHPYGRKAPQPDRNPEEPDLPRRAARSWGFRKKASAIRRMFTGPT